MANKTRKPKLSQAEKAGLAKIKRAGLYKPKKTRAAPTRYAKSILQNLKDFVSGKAQVVTVKEKRRKGHKTAREYASGKKAGTIRAVRNKLIVPAQAGEKVRFSKKTGKVRVTRKVGADTYVREPFKSRSRDIDNLLAKLKRGDRVSVPLFRGSRGVEWMNFTPEDFRIFYATYANKYKGLLDYVEAFRIEGPSARDIEDPYEDEDEYE